MLDIAMLKILWENSSKVVSWYAHGVGDQCKSNQATVRGPYGRWFHVSGGEGYQQQGIAYLLDDALYAAAAMNAVPQLIARIEQLESLIYEDIK